MSQGLLNPRTFLLGSFGVILTTALLFLAVNSSTKTTQNEHPIPEYLQPFRPLPIKIINSLGVALDKMGLLEKVIPLDSKSFLQRACKKLSNIDNDTTCILERSNGLEDFGGDQVWRSNLDQLLRTLREESNLNMMGRIVAQGQITDVLVTRGKLLKTFQENPSIANDPIQDPIFIVGFPRSGTTFLQRLLAVDPANRAPTLWEYQDPVPKPPPPPPVNASQAEFDDYDEKTRNRIAVEQWKVDQYKQLAPGFDAMHPVEATNPEECIIALNYAMEAGQFSIVYPIHSYIMPLLSKPDHQPALRFHRRVLQHLQQDDDDNDVYGRRRWVLKAPFFLAMLDDIRKVYPNAKIIQTHREPTQSVLSISSLVTKTYGIVSDDIDLKRISLDHISMLQLLLEKALKVRKQWVAEEETTTTTTTNASSDEANENGNSFRIVDVHLRDLQNDPIKTVDFIYKTLFDTGLSSSTAQLMREWLSQNPRNKHGDHRPVLSHFGLEGSDRMESEIFQTYREMFDVKSAASLSEEEEEDEELLHGIKSGEL